MLILMTIPSICDKKGAVARNIYVQQSLLLSLKK